MNIKYKKLNDFRLNKKTGHPSYAYKQEGKYINSIGITHNDKQTKVKKTKLSKNPNPKDDKPTYVKHEVEKQKFNTYKKKSEYNNWKFAKKDKSVIDSIIKKNKKR